MNFEDEIQVRYGMNALRHRTVDVSSADYIKWMKTVKIREGIIVDIKEPKRLCPKTDLVRLKYHPARGCGIVHELFVRSSLWTYLLLWTDGYEKGL